MTMNFERGRRVGLVLVTLTLALLIGIGAVVSGITDMQGMSIVTTAYLFEYEDANANGFRDGNESFFVVPLNEGSWAYWFYSDAQCSERDFTDGFQPVLPGDNTVELLTGCRYFVQGGQHETAGEVGKTCTVGSVVAEGNAMTLFLPRSCPADNLLGTPTPIIRTATPTSPWLQPTDTPIPSVTPTEQVMPTPSATPTGTPTADSISWPIEHFLPLIHR